MAKAKPKVKYSDSESKSKSKARAKTKSTSKTKTKTKNISKNKISSLFTTEKTNLSSNKKLKSMSNFKTNSKSKKNILFHQQTFGKFGDELKINSLLNDVNLIDTNKLTKVKYYPLFSSPYFKLFGLTKFIIKDFNDKVFKKNKKHYEKLVGLIKNLNKKTNIKTKPNYNKVVKEMKDVIDDEFNKLSLFIKKNYEKEYEDYHKKIMSDFNFIRYNMKLFFNNALKIENIITKSGYKTFDEIEEDKKIVDDQLFVYLKFLIKTKKINIDSDKYETLSWENYSDLNNLIQFFDFINISTNNCNLNKQFWYCTNSYDKFFNSYKRIGSDSVNGLVFKTNIRDTDVDVIIKTTPYFYNNNILHFDMLVYEFLIQRELNIMSLYCPNYTIGLTLFSCQPSKELLKLLAANNFSSIQNKLKSDITEIKQFCEPYSDSIKLKNNIYTSTAPRLFSVSEFVKSDESLYDLEMQNNDVEYLNCILQISCGLIYGINKLSFTHHDLHFDNILLTNISNYYPEYKEKNKHLLVYDFSNNKYLDKICCYNRYFCKIIDYGRVSIKNTDKIKNILKSAFKKTINFKKNKENIEQIRLQKIRMSDNLYDLIVIWSRAIRKLSSNYYNFQNYGQGYKRLNNYFLTKIIDSKKHPAFKSTEIVAASKSIKNKNIQTPEQFVKLILNFFDNDEDLYKMGFGKPKENFKYNKNLFYYSPTLKDIKNNYKVSDEEELKKILK